MGMMWRADFVFHFVGVMTDFHSGRLRATIGYGAPGYTAAEVSIFKNQIMDFTAGSEINSVRADYNAATEYLYRCGTKGGQFAVQNYSMGTFAISVANKLVCPETVSPAIEVLVFVHTENVRIRESLNFVDTPIVKVTPSGGGRMFAMGNPSGPIEAEPERVDELNSSVAQPITTSSDNVQKARACKLDVGRKFEYVWTDFMEIFRRFCRVTLDPQDFIFRCVPSVEGLFTTTMTFGVCLPQVSKLFYLWKGHLSFRIFITLGGFAPGAVQNPARLENIPVVKLIHWTEGESIRPNADFFYQDTTTDGNIYQPLNTYELQPSENPFPLNINTTYIDVSVPFNSLFNYLPTTFDSHNKIPRYSGVVGVYFDTNVTVAVSDIEIYVKAGDDFRLGAPLPLVSFHPVETKGATPFWYGDYFR